MPPRRLTAKRSRPATRPASPQADVPGGRAASFRRSIQIRVPDTKGINRQCELSGLSNQAGNKDRNTGQKAASQSAATAAHGRGILSFMDSYFTIAME